MANKRKNAQPQRWGLQPGTSSDRVQQEDVSGQGPHGNKRAKRANQQLGSLSVRNTAESCNPFFQLLFVQPSQPVFQANSTSVRVETVGTDAAQLLFSLQPSDRSLQGGGVQVQLDAPSPTCCTSLLRLLKSGRLTLGMHPLPCEPACLQPGGLEVATVYRCARPSPSSLIALPNQPSSPGQLQPEVQEQSEPAPDYACFGGLDEGQRYSSSMHGAWLPTCLISHRASSYLPSSSQSESSHSSAAGAEAMAGAPSGAAASSSAAAESQLWSLEIGLPMGTSAGEASSHGVAPAGADGGDSSSLDPEDTTKREWQLDMLCVLGWMLPHAQLSTAQGQMQGMAAADELDVAQVYAAVKPRGTEPLVVPDPPKLKPRLREYQKRAVAWMLQREHAQCAEQCIASGVHSHQQQQQQQQHQQQQRQGQGSSSEPPLHPLFRRVDTLGPGPPFFVNPYTGHVLHKAPLPPENNAATVRGGILAEEMGLGKTVELVTTILSNRFGPSKACQLDSQPTSEASKQQEEAEPRVERIQCPCGFASSDLDDDGGYAGVWVRCDACLAWMHGECVGCKRAPQSDTWVCQLCQRAMASQQVTEPCGATLIVCPAPILSQWWDEIHKHCHASGLRVMVYNGQMQPGPSSSAVASAAWAAPAGSRVPAATAAASVNPPAGRAQACHGTKRGAGASARKGSSTSKRGDVQQGGSSQGGASDGPQQRMGDISTKSGSAQEENRERQAGRAGGLDAVGVEKPGAEGQGQGVRRSSTKGSDVQQKEDGGRAAGLAGGLDGAGVENSGAEGQGQGGVRRSLPRAARGKRPRWWLEEEGMQVGQGEVQGEGVEEGMRQVKEEGKAEDGSEDVAELGGGRVGLVRGRRRGGQGGRAGAAAPTREVPLEALALPPHLVRASDLAAADIVLTTYDVLKHDVARQPDLESQQKQFRRHKRYEVVPTPLTRLKWWRVVLDEAQMVETSTAKAAEMALKLDAVHRWCVSGTPISRGLEDVYGLVAFLGIRPWANRTWWNRALQHPAESGCPQGRQRLLDLLRPSAGGIMWRSSKRDVAHELGIPPQFAHTTTLALSAVERHFYTRQHSECASKARQVLPASLLAEAQAAGMAAVPSTPLQSPVKAAGARARAASGGGEGIAEVDRALTLQESKRLMLPLLRLRQACCHPQVGAGGIKSISHQKAPMSMEEILQVLVAKARVEAEEAQRALVASLNGLAALRLLTAQEPQQQQGCVDLDVQQAATMYYSEAVQTMDTNKKDIDTDPLQRLHTLYNLSALLKQAAHLAAGAQQGQDNGHHSTSPALPAVLAASCASWSALEAEATQIRTKYLQQRWLRLVAQQHDFDKTKTSAGYNALPQQSPAQKQRQPHQGQLQKKQQGGEDEEDGIEGEVQEANKASWFLEAIDMISSIGRHEDVKDLVKNKLLENDTYRQQTTVNASSMANRFRNLHGLKVVLTEALDGIERSRAKAMDKLQELTQACANPSPAFVEQAGSCHRCRSELGVRGRLCEHCKLDELQVNWEVNLFALYSRALTAGGQVSAEDAARRAHANNLQRVGKGGLGEEEAQDTGAVAGSDGRRGEKVTETNIVWHPSEAEQVLRLLATQFRTLLGGGGRRGPGGSSTSGGSDRAEAVLQCAKEHLGQLEAQRKLFAQARALSLTQRMLLYAHDELDMAVTRMRLRVEGEHVQPHEENFKLHPAEVPVKQRELSDELALAKADLRRTLGTLRYLRSLQDQHKRAAGQQQPQQQQGPTAPSGVAAEARAAGQAAGAPPPSPPALPSSADASTKATDASTETTEPGAAAASATHPPSPVPPLAANTCTEATKQGAAAAAGVPAGVAAEAAPPTPAVASHQLVPAALPGAVGFSAAAGCGVVAAAHVSVPSGPVAPAAGGVDGGGPAEGLKSICPICHEELGTQCTVLPCGHQVCINCFSMLVDRIPAQVQPAHRRINCPTCRAMANVQDVAHVDAARKGPGTGPSEAAAAAHTTSVLLSGAPLGPLPGPLLDPASPPSPAAAAAPAAAAPAAAAPATTNAGSPVAASAPFVCMPWAAAEQQVHVRGSYGTKVEAIVRRLSAILMHDAAAKVVVFSSWVDLLEIISHALGVNQLPFVFPRTRKAFHSALAAFRGPLVGSQQLEEQDAFLSEEEKHAEGSGNEEVAKEEEGTGGEAACVWQQHQQKQQEQLDGRPLSLEPDSQPLHTQRQGSDELERNEQERGPRRKKAKAGPTNFRPVQICTSPRILLLNTSQGGAGLNITEAQHVLFAEPLLDAAAEAQAIGRVHRIGQTRETHVHRFIVRDTIEESVHALAAQRRELASSDPCALSSARARVQEALSVRDVALLLNRSACAQSGGGQREQQAAGGQDQPGFNEVVQGQQQGHAGISSGSTDTGAAAIAPLALPGAADAAAPSPPRAAPDPRAAAASAAEARWAAANSGK